MRFLISTLCLVLILSTVASGKIVFYSFRDGVTGIYVMNDDGSNLTLLTDTLKPRLPRWSPDGKQIVFQRWVHPHDSQDQHIFLMNADGTNIRQLTAPQDAERDGYPTFSPNGKSIVFSRYDPIVPPNPVPPGFNWNNGDSICVMDLESGQIKKIADMGATFFDWSPDGKQIVFKNIAVFGKTNSNIWIMGADGHNPRELLPPALPGISRYRPRWSPDGKQILYYHIQTQFAVIDGVGHLIPQEYRFFIYDIKGKRSRQLRIPKNWRISGLEWIDDGKSVIVSAVAIKLNQPPDGTPYLYNIYKYQIQTGKITRLTNHPGKDFSPDWISDQARSVSPAGKMLTQWGTLKAF